MALLWAASNAQSISICYCIEISEPILLICVGLSNILIKDYEAGYMRVSPFFSVLFEPFSLPLMVAIQHVKHDWYLRPPCVHLVLRIYQWCISTMPQISFWKKPQTPKPCSSMEGWLPQVPTEVSKWVWRHIVRISIRCLYVTKQTQAPFMVNGEWISSVHGVEGVVHLLKYTPLCGWIKWTVNSIDSTGYGGSPGSQFRFTSYNGRCDECHLFWSYRSSFNAIAVGFDVNSM